MSEPSMWSSGNPRLQIAWDATSLGALMFCPTYYKRTIQEGWRAPGKSVHLEFGGMFASSVETYKRRRIAGDSRDEAQIAAVAKAFELSERWEKTEEQPHEGWLTERWLPWGGAWVRQWHCTGTVPFHNDKGNRAKCPYAHVGKWFEGDHAAKCGLCGSLLVEQENWLTDHPDKDRFALVRLVAWYCEEQPRDRESGLQPYAFPDGTAAVELPFRLPLPYTTPYGETYLLCGYLDSIVSYGDDHYWADNKTSKNPINGGFFKQFSPSVQMDTYDLAASVLFPDLSIAGGIIEGAQTVASGASFNLGIIERTEEQREEWLAEIGWWLRLAEVYAAGVNDAVGYPMNRKNCTFCEFKPVCSLPASRREGQLEATYTKRFWNPLSER